MDYFEAVARREHVKDLEAEGKVADNMTVRLALMARVHAGEITLKQAQSELRRIKRDAKRNGLTTRDKAFKDLSA